MRFRKDRKVAWNLKSGIFFVPSYQNRGHYPLTDTPKFDVFQSSNGYLWWYPVCASHQRNLGPDELTSIGDLISVTLDTNGHQICLNLKIS